MGKAVQLREVADMIGWYVEGGHNYLDRESGEVISVSPFCDDWEDLNEEIEAGYGDRYLRLPDQNDFDELEWMREFALGLEDRRIGQRLLAATERGHRYRRFKETARELGVIDAWHAARDAHLREEAIEWCAEQGVEWTEEAVG